MYLKLEFITRDMCKGQISCGLLKQSIRFFIRIHERKKQHKMSKLATRDLALFLKCISDGIH